MINTINTNYLIEDFEREKEKESVFLLEKQIEEEEMIDFNEQLPAKIVVINTLENEQNKHKLNSLPF